MKRKLKRKTERKINKEKKRGKNLAAMIPARSESISWDADGEGLVTIHAENKGVMKRLTQLLLKKPKVSHIHLDEIGSFVWQCIDGESAVDDIAVSLEEHFGERTRPTYGRLGQYFTTLVSCGFVRWKDSC